MTRIEVAVVEPKYQQNLGYIARVAKNFGVSKLILVSPRCNYKGKAAIKYSKHGVDLLTNATILNKFSKIKSDLLIGTTGIWHKSNSSYYNVYDPKLMKIITERAKSTKKRIVLLIGREDSGLSREELFACDLIVFIGTSPSYPVLNISHALGILLYELEFENMSKSYSLNQFYSEPKHQDQLTALFDLLVKTKSNIKNKRAVSAAFKRIIRRSIPTKKEINAVSAALSRNKEKRSRY